MKFMLTFSIKPEGAKRDEAIARFQKTGGMPPKGIRFLGRWTRVDSSGGFDLLRERGSQGLDRLRSHEKVRHVCKSLKQDRR